MESSVSFCCSLFLCREMWLCAVKGKSELVVCFGELLIDFVPTVGGLSLADAPAFKKAPGGAPANVAVGIARLGGNAAFVGKVLFCHCFFAACIRIFPPSINQLNFRSYDDVFYELDHEGTSTFSTMSRFLSYYHVGFGIWSCSKLHQPSSDLLISSSVLTRKGFMLKTTVSIYKRTSGSLYSFASFAFTFSLGT